ncbi:hypothetical protein FNV43_RR01411 [Rhamnella rubrinervis]|uniref:RNase H type-1 domain-containing protein n=1 Tax=Rhamnella rubrinervis TaxID=2594499 RepID=A0A8K0MS92_9ROSA|nr:hypothetical protein FNV43_RR01411 [Rhamnella rubrinervis]
MISTIFVAEEPQRKHKIRKLLKTRTWEEEEDKFWEKLWKAKLHERLKVFLWRMVSGALPLKQVIFSRTRKGSPECPCCGNEEESAIHRFKSYEVTKRLAYSSLWGCRLEAWNCSTVKELGSMNWRRKGGNKLHTTPNTADWSKVNTDAEAALAVVMRDEKGRVLYLASYLTNAGSSLEAELKALEWALELAVEKEWNKVIWSSDAQAAVNEVKSVSDPCSWDTRYLVLNCRDLL